MQPPQWPAVHGHVVVAGNALPVAHGVGVVLCEKLPVHRARREIMIAFTTTVLSLSARMTPSTRARTERRASWPVPSSVRRLNSFITYLPLLIAVGSERDTQAGFSPALAWVARAICSCRPPLPNHCASITGKRMSAWRQMPGAPLVGTARTTTLHFQGNVSKPSSAHEKTGHQQEGA